MSQGLDGICRCDRCGRELQTGNVNECAIIIDLDDATGRPCQYHLCRDWQDDDGRLIRGCVARVLTRSALAANPPTRNKDVLTHQRHRKR